MLFTNFLDYSKKGKLVYKGSLKEGSQMVIEEETCEWEAVEK
jgi:hypothetical protein